MDAGHSHHQFGLGLSAGYVGSSLTVLPVARERCRMDSGGRCGPCIFTEYTYMHCLLLDDGVRNEWMGEHSGTALRDGVQDQAPRPVRRGRLASRRRSRRCEQA